MDTELLAILVTLGIGITGFVVTYINNLRLDKRKDRFALISRQIGELYGPLYAVTNANEISLRMYKSQNGGHIFKNIDYPTEDEVKAWISFFKNTLFPNNEMIEELIINKTHLIVEQDMPVHFQEMIAHMVYCRVILQQWTQENLIEVLPAVGYPDQLSNYVKSTFNALKQEQGLLYK